MNNLATVSLLITLAFSLGRFTTALSQPTNLWIEGLLFFVLWMLIVSLIGAISSMHVEPETKKEELSEKALSN